MRTIDVTNQMPGTLIIQTATVATVLLSIFAHGFTVNPGARRYARDVADLDTDAPEFGVNS